MWLVRCGLVGDVGCVVVWWCIELILLVILFVDGGGFVVVCMFRFVVIGVCWVVWLFV